MGETMTEQPVFRQTLLVGPSGHVPGPGPGTRPAHRSWACGDISVPRAPSTRHVTTTRLLQAVALHTAPPRSDPGTGEALQRRPVPRRPAAPSTRPAPLPAAAPRCR